MDADFGDEALDYDDEDAEDVPVRDRDVDPRARAGGKPK